MKKIITQIMVAITGERIKGEPVNDVVSVTTYEPDTQVDINTWFRHNVRYGFNNNTPL